MSNQTINDGDPAFPCDSTNKQFPTQCGMSLRDWFAGKAYHSAWMSMHEGYYEGGNTAIAECAYQMADAMIAAKFKTQGGAE